MVLVFERSGIGFRVLSVRWVMVLYVEGVWGVGDVDVIVDEFMSKVCSSR